MDKFQQCINKIKKAGRTANYLSDLKMILNAFTHTSFSKQKHHV